ncbi:MAG: radical SAM protein [Desulfobacteraceae bacterium]|nr:radical SAM protein [Desulfobacteraceae bacterium]
MKFRTVLINPRLRAWSPTVLLPLGLSYIAAVLEKEGDDVEIIDMNARKISAKHLQKSISGADMVGITGMITEYQEVLRVIDIVRDADKQVKVVLGGPLATTIPQEILQVSQVDFVVIGEGERTIVDLTNALKQGGSSADIKGIGYKENDHVIINDRPEPIADLDTIPFPTRHLLDLKNYVQNQFHSFSSKMEGIGKINSTNMITSRGCPYSCTFCFKDMWGHKWRGRSPENILEEIEHLYTRYGINGFFFNDDTFVLDRDRVFRLCDLLKAKKLNIAWYCNGRVNLMTRELLKAMREAGCREIAYGIESGNQQTLDSLKKNITLDQVRNVIMWTKEAGINANGFFMIGMPGETKDNIHQTIAFAEELDLDFYGFSLLTPLPETELYDKAIEKGLTRADLTSLKDWDFNVNANLTADCSDDDLITLQNEIFRKFALRNLGNYYMFNPAFLKRIAKVMLSLQNIKEAKDFARRAKGIIRSYWRKV